jgi:hypothetical protein
MIYHVELDDGRWIDGTPVNWIQKRSNELDETTQRATSGSCTFLPYPTHPSLTRLLTKVKLVLSVGPHGRNRGMERSVKRSRKG